VIAIIDWSAAAALKENERFLQQAGGRGQVRPREWRDKASAYRSLTLWEDGTCELQRFSAAAITRRLTESSAGKTVWKARAVERD
jgi:hypothetical protein